jgi:AcrR family transcriptional regulator
VPAGRRAPSARAIEREQEIYDVAAELFHVKGYAATSLQDIAQAVGILKGSLYYYIDSKEDLLYRITRTIHENARANLAAAEAVPGPAVDRLRALVESHVSAFGRHLTYIRVFYTEYGALTGDRRREIMAERRTYEQFVYALLKEASADGSICPDVDARVVGNAMLTMINSVYVWYRPERDGPITTIARAYGDYAINGLRCAPDHDHRRLERRSDVC